MNGHSTFHGHSEQTLDRVLTGKRRILLFGAPGSGKSTLTAALARRLAAEGSAHCVLSADPGSPAFGPPGALALGRWDGERWQIDALEALCTLDAARFRLPLLSALHALLQRAGSGTLLIDPPGLVRGAAAAELLEAAVRLVEPDRLLVLQVPGTALPLESELRALRRELIVLPASAEARRPSTTERARERTRRWDAWLEEACRLDLELGGLNLLGCPPPLEEGDAWTGRQAALFREGRLVGLGEVEAMAGGRIVLRAAAQPEGADALLLRDARRTPEGLLRSAEPWRREPPAWLSPGSTPPTVANGTGPRLALRTGPLDLTLVNGIFGDPLLHARVRHSGHAFLFDLGESTRLSARSAHQLSDVFITHAHLDHIAGFIWLLRSRIGDFPPCRLYGPPGLAQNISGFVRGATWDRVELHGPRFEVLEFDGRRLRHFHLQATEPEPRLLEERDAGDGVVLREADFQVRALMLDHLGIETVAYAFEPARQVNVRKDRLQAQGLAPGPWLGALKQAIVEEASERRITLPDGRASPAGELAAELLFITPGKRLVYATDFADTGENRRRLAALARNAHTLFCESSFREKDSANAARTGHLTTRACAEIAGMANVSRLIPFHFSRRYADDPASVYAEISAIFPRVEVPPAELLND